MGDAGAAAGAATLPFAGEGRSLAARSLLHVGVTGTLYALLLVLCLDVPLRTLPAWLGMLGALYLVVWLGRWVGWCAEAAAIREKLGRMCPAGRAAVICLLGLLALVFGMYGLGFNASAFIYSRF